MFYDCESSFIMKNVIWAQNKFYKSQRGAHLKAK